MSLEVTLHRLDNWEEIDRRGKKLKMVNPLDEYRCIVRFKEFSFPVPGHYQFSLVAEGEVLAQKKIVDSEEEESQ